ncbi:PepSY domain-containing protein [Komagataeibacter sp. FXV3]|uniref:PepSY-associated TM helix domain-containing protein n=1 Tax=Komagataeibacter sp. FXV3 TaxID=2608998 RepID=UPI00187BB2F1|nr:PepSY-associated TM helix domain-containing protein [Komagataeibacter sp. FXV3]MBE7728465.1 PepSY domain-containing protein [Komagataeibacter sp. FXV3]
MRETLRTRMGWLHGWAGFLVGLLAVCIFMTGTLSVFDTEITRWMQPENQVPANAPLTGTALNAASSLIHEQQVHGASVFLTLPSARSPTIDVLHYDGRQFVGTLLDPRTGTPVPVRATMGGTFFFSFHYTLLEGTTGTRIVNIVGVILLVAIGSGIVIHIRALVPDIIRLRLSAARLRGWLDAHLLVGVLFLPFTIMIIYTGVLVNVGLILPATPLTDLFVHEKPQTIPASDTRAAPDIPLPLPPLAPLLATARNSLQGRDAGFILFSPDHLSIYASDASGPFLTRDHVDFHLPDGHLLGTTTTPGHIAHTMQVMHGLHYARFACLDLRWLYFVSGLCATAMIASGLVLFLMKRRSRSGHRIGFRVGESLTITTLTGLPVSILAFLWCNRLLPASMVGRDRMEVACFLGIWILCTGHASLCASGRCMNRAWGPQLRLIALLGGGLPVLDILACPRAVYNLPAIHAAIDGTGLLAAVIALSVRRRLEGDGK